MNFVDLKFIEKCVSQFANCTEKDRPFTRLVFSEEFIQGRAWLTQKFKELNLIFGRDTRNRTGKPCGTGF